MSQYIFVTGGVVSGLGKGIVAASLGNLLKQRGLSISVQKLDPYMNVDPGTMSPLQHGEVFVTDDGAETDLDLGHYERFIDINLNQKSNLTSGRVYWNVLSREREGGYLGKTVQVIPQITDEIKDFIYNGSAQSDIHIVEIGGTTGDIEGQPFLEAIRQLASEVGTENCVFIHLTYVPYLSGSNEHKSKPTQHSVKELRSIGLSPDIIVARTDSPLNQDIIKKIALFCNVRPNCVIENLTLNSIYEAPAMLHGKNLDEVVCKKLKLQTQSPVLGEWGKMEEKLQNQKKILEIGLVGKYVGLQDAYLSVVESLNHAGLEVGTSVKISFIDCETLTAETVGDILSKVNGILIPGGFGDRGFEGKILACEYARENNVPFLGICLGMQVAVIEFARHLCSLTEATSGEFSPESDCQVIHFIEDQKRITQKGGTMRLGSYPCKITPDSLLSKLYEAPTANERHRHRCEVNNDYREQLAEKGLVISGVSPDDTLVEAVEIPAHPFFIAVQFHPEFKSRPNKPHPLFDGFVKASIEYGDKIS